MFWIIKGQWTGEEEGWMSLQDNTVNMMMMLLQFCDTEIERKQTKQKSSSRRTKCNQYTIIYDDQDLEMLDV